MVGIEGIGEAVTGGMVARAVEPDHGEAQEAGTACLNCGAELVGPYCHRCGQKGHVHRTVAAWWHDFLHSVLHLDGKFWRTLPLLAWRPGELTRRYIDGQRARFVSPLAFFLFSVFLMFAVFSVTGATMVGASHREEAQRDIATELDSLRRQAAALEAQRRQRAAAGQDVTAIDPRLRALRSEIAQIEKAEGLVEGGPFGADANTGWARLDEGLRKANENQALLFYKIQNNAYKFSWALIPISVPFLWLLMLHRGRYRREYKAYDHLVFVTYSIAFMSLLLILFVVLRSIGISSRVVTLGFLLIPPIHIYRQLRGAYGLGWFSAAWRTLALLIFASVALTIFLLLLLAIGVLG